MAGSLFGRRVHGNSLNKIGQFRPNLIAFLVVSVFIILYAGWRNNVGDTFFYLHTYHLLEEGAAVRPTLSTPHYLFEMFQWLMVSNGLSSGTFIMISYLFFAIPALITMEEYSEDFTWVIFFFFVTGTYISSMNGIRQFMAEGIVLMGTPLLVSRRRTGVLPYVFIVILAYLFHSAALIMIPLYFVCRQRAWSLPTILVVLGAAAALVFVSLFNSSFLDLLKETSYGNYDSEWFSGGEETGTTTFRALVNWIPAGLAFYYTPQLRARGPIADVFINFSVVHAAIYMIALYNWIFARFAIFTCIYVIILLSMIMSVIQRDPQGKWIVFFAIILYLIFFIKDAYSNNLYIFYGSEYFKYNNNTWFKFLA